MYTGSIKLLLVLQNLSDLNMHTPEETENEATGSRGADHVEVSKVTCLIGQEGIFMT